MEDKNLIESFESLLDIDGKGDKHPQANISLTVGVVVDTDDPLQEGRLRIFCASLNDDPKKIHHVPWAAYVSPFGGVVNNPCFARGSDPSNCMTQGAVHYGFWAIPEQGAHVLVGCIDGDPRRRFWIGCFPSHQETHTLFNGRYKWNGQSGTPDGPLSSANEKIQPLYDNMSKAWSNDRESHEWRTRGADFQPTVVSGSVGEVPNADKDTYLDEEYDQIAQAEPDQWVKDLLGSHGYDWTSFKNLGAFKSSKVFGLTTPGMHTLMMDDRPFNSRVKLRSTSGHVILMDDTNERIYVATSEGNNWIELDSNGNIDIYSKRRVSVHAEDDINFSTEKSFRVKAKEGIYMYAGDTPGAPLTEVPAPGQIRLQSSNDMHIYSDTNIRMFGTENIFIEAEQDMHMMNQNLFIETSQNMDLDVGQSLNVLASQSIIAAVNNGRFEINTSEVTLEVGSTQFQVDASSIVSRASSDVYFMGGTIQGSIISINTSFTQKQNGGGAAMVTNPAPTISPISPPTISVDPSEAEISPWTNRVPQHEPWPRVLKQSSDKPVNQPNDGYKSNVDWIDQFDNTSSPSGVEPIGKIEGDATIPRGDFWRR